MSVRVDSSPLIAGAVVVGVPGHGVLAETVPSTGESGAGYIYDQLTFPADDGKEVRGEITMWPSAGTLYAYEDTSFTFSDAPDGEYSFTYQLYVDGVARGEPQVVALIVGGGEGVTLTPLPGHITATGHAPSIVAGAAQTLTPIAGAVIASGHSPVITQGAAQSLTPTAGAVTAAGHVPVLEQGFAQSLTPVAGRAAAQGHRPEIQQDSGITLTPTVGHVRAAGHAPALAQPRTLTPQAGRVAALGHRPSVSQSVTLAPQPGRVSARGHRPGIEQGGARTLTPVCGRLRLTGYRPTIGPAGQEGDPTLKNSIFISLPADNGVFITARAGGDAFVSG